MAARTPTSGSRRAGTWPRSFDRGRYVVSLFLVVLIAALFSASPASAHGDEESEEGYLLVQQALGHLAHDTTDTGVALAMEKVDDALDAEDQDGVDVAGLQRAEATLEAGDVKQGRAELEQSISEALSELPSATGDETGTTTVPDALPGGGPSSVTDWVFLVLSVLLLGLGGWFSWRFRPPDNLRHLRARLGPGAAAVNPPTRPEKS